MAYDLRERTAVVTGAGSGIGRALARRLAGEGMRLGLLDIDGAAAAELAAQLGAAGHEVLARACDVRDEAAVQTAITAVVRRFGRLDVLVNNAGIAHRSLFEATAAEVHRRVMAVNFDGAVHGTRAALPHLIASRGCVVGMASIAGFAPLIGRTAYAASKHAVHGFFETLRGELRRHGVHVLLVYPWYTATPIETNALGGDGQPLRRSKPVVGRALRPEDVAEAITRALRRRRERLVLTALGRLAWYLSRLAPRLYERLMLRRTGGEFD